MILKIAAVMIGVGLSCVLLLNMATTGTELAEQVDWKLKGCRSQFEGSQEDLCVTTIRHRRTEEAQRILEELSDMVVAPNE